MKIGASVRLLESSHLCSSVLLLLLWCTDLAACLCWVSLLMFSSSLLVSVRCLLVFLLDGGTAVEGRIFFFLIKQMGLQQSDEQDRIRNLSR